MNVKIETAETLASRVLDLDLDPRQAQVARHGARHQPVQVAEEPVACPGRDDTCVILLTVKVVDELGVVHLEERRACGDRLAFPQIVDASKESVR